MQPKNKKRRCTSNSNTIKTTTSNSNSSNNNCNAKMPCSEANPNRGKQSRAGQMKIGGNKQCMCNGGILSMPSVVIAGKQQQFITEF